MAYYSSTNYFTPDQGQRDEKRIAQLLRQLACQHTKNDQEIAKIEKANSNLKYGRTEMRSQRKDSIDSDTVINLLRFDFPIFCTFQQKIEKLRTKNRIIDQIKEQLNAEMRGQSVARDIILSPEPPPFAQPDPDETTETPFDADEQRMWSIHGEGKGGATVRQKIGGTQ